MNTTSSLRFPAILAGRLIILAIFFGLWEWAAVNGYLRPVLFGQPSGIATFLWREIFITGSLFDDFAATMTAVAMAFLLGSVIGILVGMIFVISPTVEALFYPILTALNAMPRIALAPLFLIWFGLGLGSKVAVGFSLSFFIVLSSTVAGARSVDADHMTLSRTLGATPVQAFLKFVMPNAVPVIFNGLRLGLVFSLLGVVASEILAAEQGMGQQLSAMAASFRTNGVFAIIFLLALLGVSITFGMNWVERRILKWR